MGRVAPFVIYLAAEEVHGSGVLAVVVAALILGQRSFHAGYATRLQDFAVWRAIQLVLESFAFLMIGLQLPTVVGELAGISASVIVDLIGGRVRDRHRRPDRVGVRLRLPAAHAVGAHPGARTRADARAGLRRRVGGYARRGLAGRGVRCADDDAVGCAVPRAPAHGVPHLRRRHRHTAAARADPAVADPTAGCAGRRSAHRRDRRRGRAGQGREGGGQTGSTSCWPTRKRPTCT